MALKLKYLRLMLSKLLKLTYLSQHKGWITSKTWKTNINNLRKFIDHLWVVFWEPQSHLKMVYLSLLVVNNQEMKSPCFSNSKYFHRKPLISRLSPLAMTQKVTSIRSAMWTMTHGSIQGIAWLRILGRVYLFNVTNSRNSQKRSRSMWMSPSIIRRWTGSRRRMLLISAPTGVECSLSI
jgi:hypothetical protein